MKKGEENKQEKIEETKEQLIRLLQDKELSLRILEEEKSLKEVEVYRRQHLILLSEQNQTLKGIGLALNRIGMILENSEGGVETSIPQDTEELEEEVEEEPEEVEEEIEEEEVEEEPTEESPKPLTKEELKLQKKIERISAKMKKIQDKKK